MIIENIDALKVWLNNCLSAITDADPSTLARYVIALLKKSKTLEELREICLSQLDVFLKDHTTGFVDKLIRTLDTESYMSGSVSDPTGQPLRTSVTHGETTSNKVVPASSNELRREIVPSRKRSHSRSPAGTRSQWRSRSPAQHFSRRRSSSRSPDRLRIRRSRSPAGRRRSRSRNLDRKLESSYKDERTRSKVTASSRSARYERSPSPTSRSRHRSDSRSAGKRSSDEAASSQDHKSSSGATLKQDLETADSTDLALSRKRCHDYDAKGFCLRGDLCPFDHGINPVVVDDLGGLTYASAASVGPISPAPVVAQSMRTTLPTGNPGDSQLMQLPLTAIFNPGLPPPGMAFTHLPPPPLRQVQGRVVLPPPGDVIQTEAYNPEAPAMQLSRPHYPPPYLSAPEGLAHAPIPPPLATSSPRFPAGRHQPRFDHRRGQQRPINVEKTTLELRKIPPSLNRMDVLLEHFKAFGTVVNLQIRYEGDPEAALVSFATNSEARAAHQSSAPVLNNRFIKVFWHNKQQSSPEAASMPDHLSALPADDNMVVSVSNTSSVREVRRPGVSAKERIELPAKHQLSLSNVKNKTLAEKQMTSPAAGTQDTVTMPAKCTLTRTVVNPSAVKQRKSSVTAGDVIPTSVSVTRTVSSVTSSATPISAPGKRMTPHQKEQESQKLKLELQRRTQQLLEKQLQQQKLLLVKLEKKTLSADDRAVVMKTLNTLSDHVQRLQAELKSAVAKPILAPPPVAKRLRSPVPSVAADVVKELTPKAILDTELDLIHKQYEGADAAELYKKVAELKSEAVSLGLIGPGFKVEPKGQGHVLKSTPHNGDSENPLSDDGEQHPIKESAVASDDARDDEVLLDAAYEDVDVGSGL